LQSHEKALEKEHCLPGVFRDTGDTPANFFCELNGHFMTSTSRLNGKRVEELRVGQCVIIFLIVKPTSTKPQAGKLGYTK